MDQEKNVCNRFPIETTLKETKIKNKQQQNLKVYTEKDGSKRGG